MKKKKKKREAKLQNITCKRTKILIFSLIERGVPLKKSKLTCKKKKKKKTSIKRREKEGNPKLSLGLGRRVFLATKSRVSGLGISLFGFGLSFLGLRHSILGFSFLFLGP